MHRCRPKFELIQPFLFLRCSCCQECYCCSFYIDAAVTRCKNVASITASWKLPLSLCKLLPWPRFDACYWVQLSAFPRFPASVRFPMASFFKNVTAVGAGTMLPPSPCSHCYTCNGYKATTAVTASEILAPLPLKNVTLVTVSALLPLSSLQLRCRCHHFNCHCFTLLPLSPLQKCYGNRHFNTVAEATATGQFLPLSPLQDFKDVAATTVVASHLLPGSKMSSLQECYLCLPLSQLQQLLPLSPPQNFYLLQELGLRKQTFVPVLIT